MCIRDSNYVVTLLLTLLNLVGFDLVSYDSLLPSSAFECVLLAVSTAVAPAVCEELAFRCCSLQFLRKNGKAFAVVASSMIFGLLHANVLQFIFATLVGCLLYTSFSFRKSKIFHFIIVLFFHIVVKIRYFFFCNGKFNFVHSVVSVSVVADSVSLVYHSLDYFGIVFCKVIGYKERCV